MCRYCSLDYYGPAIYMHYTALMDAWQCNVCGHIIDDDSIGLPLPDRCPKCGVKEGDLVAKYFVCRNIAHGLDNQGHAAVYHQWFGGRC